MSTFKNHAAATTFLCIVTDQLMRAVEQQSDEGDNMQRAALAVCIRHLDCDGEGLQAAHAVLSDAIDHAFNRVCPETRPEAGLCVLLSLAMEHPSIAQYWVPPAGKVH